MLEKSRETLQTTVEALVRSVTVSPDCQIHSHLLEGGDKGLMSRLGLDTRIVEINSNPVANSAELRDLLNAQEDSQRVCVTYERVTDSAKRVDIADSVCCDGVVCDLATQHPPEVVLNQIAEDERGVMPEETIKNTSVSLSSVSFSNQIGSGMLKYESEDDLSVASSSEFTTALGPGMRGAESNAKVAIKESTPPLLEFEQIGTLSRTDEVSHASGERLLDPTSDWTLRRRLTRAVNSVPVGACVICVCQDVNPIAEIEMIALSLGMPLVAINLGTKLRLRPRPDEFAEKFKAVMKDGGWFVVVSAHKSIATCRVLEELVRDAETRNFEGFHPSARIIICLESHPHFPRYLIKRAEITKIQSSFSMSTSSFSMATSMSRNRLVMAGSLCSMRFSTLVPIVSPAREGKGGDGDGDNGGGRRRVCISAAVDVVDIAPRDVVVPQTNASHQAEQSCNISGSVVLRSAFTGVANDKFLCVSFAGEKGRYAVGSSLGNIYFVDELGKSLMQAHVHEVSIWDVSFLEKYLFATGCEDGTCIEWKFEMGGTDAAGLAPSWTTSLNNDVYCLSYLRSGEDSALIIGGLSRNLSIRGKDGALHTTVISSNAQVMDCFPTGSVMLVGGSDGSVTAVDVSVAEKVTRFVEHTRKLPALTVRDNHHFFTGSFDSTILSWDYRDSSRPTEAVETGNIPMAKATHTLKLKNYVTGLHVDDIHLAASVGENLYLWDVRKLGEVLGGYPQGWRGLSRGLRVHSAAQSVVTASQDGYTRFWGFV